jgi:hypothetical protein
MRERHRVSGAKRGWAAALAATAVVAGLGGAQAGASSTGSAPQVITFTSSAPTGAVVHGQPYAVTATGGASGNPVVFSTPSNLVCEVVGPTVDFLGSGTCTVDADQAGNADYAAAATASQSFAVVDGPDAIVSPNTATAVAGKQFLFFVETTGSPSPNIHYGGRLPLGLKVAPRGQGFITISGEVAPEVYGVPTGGVYRSTIVAVFQNGRKIERVRQAFTLTVDEGPVVVSISAKRAHAGQWYDTIFKTTGYPVPTVTESGRLPFGVNFTDNGNHRASLTGTPNLLTAGSYPITLTASNGVGSPSVRHMILVVARP